MNIYEIYFCFCVLLLSSTLLWRLPAITAVVRSACRERSLAAGLLICTGNSQVPLSRPQGVALLSLLAAVTADWLLASHSYAQYRALFYTTDSCRSLLATQALGAVLVAPVVGPLADRTDCKHACVVAGGLLTAAALLTATADHYTLLSLAALLHGAGSGVMRCSFESWMAAEWQRRQLSCEWFSAVATLTNTAAPLAGLAASFVVETLLFCFSLPDGEADTETDEETVHHTLALLVAAAVAAVSCALASRMQSRPADGDSLSHGAAPRKRRRLRRALYDLLAHFSRSVALVLRNGGLRQLLMQQACFGAAAALCLLTWGPTLALLDDLLPYGLCGADFALAAACGASVAGLALSLVEYDARVGQAATTALKAALPTSAAPEVYRRLIGGPSCIAHLAAAVACVIVANTIYPVFTMSAFVLLYLMRSLMETAFAVRRAATLPAAPRTTLTALLRLPEQLAVWCFLASGPTTFTAPAGTQSVASLCCLLCLAAAVDAGTLRWRNRPRRRKIEGAAFV